jgi:tetratricopeptide (TPR) repeat protein
MGTPWQPRSSLSREEQALDPAREREDAPSASGLAEEPELTDEPEAPALDTLCCNFCWSPVPEGASECPGCARSLAEMEAERAARAETDRQWVPPRLQDEGAEESFEEEEFEGAAALEGPPAAPAASRRGAARRLPVLGWLSGQSLSGMLLAAGTGSLIGGAILLGWWLALSTAPQPAPEAAKGRGRAGEGISRSTVRLKWRVLVSGLRLELRTSTNRVVASSADTNRERSSAIRPGFYRLLAANTKGDWQREERRVLATSGKTLTLALAPESTAAYYLWLGDQAAQGGKPSEAERAWRKAAEADPHSVDARLRLAQLLVKSGRAAEARGTLEEAAKSLPGDARITGLLHSLP